jgi:homoserine dehydrogenase
MLLALMVFLNAVIVDGKPVGQTLLQGEGAGPGPQHLQRLVSDISSILRGNIKFPFLFLSKKEQKN